MSVSDLAPMAGAMHLRSTQWRRGEEGQESSMPVSDLARTPVVSLAVAPSFVPSAYPDERFARTRRLDRARRRRSRVTERNMGSHGALDRLAGRTDCGLVVGGVEAGKVCVAPHIVMSPVLPSGSEEFRSPRTEGANRPEGRDGGQGGVQDAHGVRGRPEGTMLSVAALLSSPRAQTSSPSTLAMKTKPQCSSTQSLDSWLSTSSILITATTKEPDEKKTRVWCLFDLVIDQKCKKQNKFRSWEDVQLDIPREWVPRSIYYRPGLSSEESAFREVALQALFQQTGMTVFNLGHSEAMMHSVTDAQGVEAEEEVGGPRSR